MTEKLVTRTEIAQCLGVSRERVRQLALHRDFPPPADAVGRVLVWRQTDVAAWAERKGRPYPV